MVDKKSFSRETAKLCPLDILLKGEYIVLDGWQPNYVDVGFDKISRINLIGVVVEKDSPNQFFLDDGFASIKVVDFNNKNLSSLELGDPVLIIGRPRKVNEKLFISSEIIAFNQLKSNPSWLTKRKHDLLTIKNSAKNISSENILSNPTSNNLIQSITKNTTSLKKNNSKDDSSSQLNTNTIISSQFESQTSSSEEKVKKILSQQLTGDDIVDFIKKKDSGDGVMIDLIIEYFGSDSEEVVNTLLTMGEIFEIRPGQVKYLE